MCGYHAQLSTVTSNIDMISVVFIRDKLVKLHASMSIHTTGVSLGIILIVWSHSLISGRASKDFLEKTDVNSFRYSRIGGDSTSELALKASAKH